MIVYIYIFITNETEWNGIFFKDSGFFFDRPEIKYIFHYEKSFLEKIFV